MPFPKTDKEFREQGYEYQNRSKCAGCGEEIEWYLTPKGKYIPIDCGTMEPHWSTCPKAGSFRRK